MTQTTWKEGDRVVNERRGQEGIVSEVRPNRFNPNDIHVSVLRNGIITTTSQAAHEYEGWQRK